MKRQLLGFLSATVLTLALGTPVFAASPPDFTTLGFQEILASTTVSPTQAATLTADGLTVNIPAGAFTTPVKFELIAEHKAALQSKLTPGVTVLQDFGFKVVDLATNQIIATFAKPVMISYTSTMVGTSTLYDNVNTNGTLVVNPIPAKIQGHTLSHPIAGSGVAWAILNVTNSTQAPDFSKLGFSKVLAQTTVAANAAATLQSGGFKVAVPAGAFTYPVSVELLQAPATQISAKLPSGDTLVTNFALRVVNLETNQVVGAFSKPVLFEYTGSGVNAHSVYENVTPQGAVAPNTVTATISGDTLSHPIAGAPVAWAVVDTPTTVPKATAPVTGLPIGSVVVFGTGLILVGTWLVRKERLHL